MAKLKLTLGCGSYDLLYPLIEGTATAAGIEFNTLTMASPERHGRMLRHEEFGAKPTKKPRTNRDPFFLSGELRKCVQNNLIL